MSKDDGLPPVVCYKCATQLKTSYDFKLQCELRDRIFRKCMINNADCIKTDLDAEDDLYDQSGGDNADYSVEMLDDEIEVKHNIIPKTEDFLSGEENDHTIEHNSDHSYVPDDPIQPPKLTARQKSKNLTVAHRCKICVRDFSCLQLLQRHMKTHSPKNKKMYACTLCNKTLAVKANMKRHIRASHLKTKPHICKICARGFLNIETLHGHEKICTGQRPHVCDICNTSFIRKDSLEAHLKLHDGNILQNTVLEELDNIDNYILVHEINEECDRSVVTKEEVGKEKFLKNTEFVLVTKEIKRRRRGWKQKRSTNEKFTCKDCGAEFIGNCI